MSNESPYSQELHRQMTTLTNDIKILVQDYNSISDIFVKIKLKTIIEQKETRLLKLMKEVENYGNS
jgi:hypothetical protein